MHELNADWMFEELEANELLTHEGEALIAQTLSDLAFADWLLEDESTMAEVRTLMRKA
jgi:hypothetical protein